MFTDTVRSQSDDKRGAGRSGENTLKSLSRARWTNTELHVREAERMHVRCYDAFPYLANSKIGRSFRDPQANAYARVSRLTSIDAAFSDVESL